MRKLLLALILSLGSSTAFAQTTVNLATAKFAWSWSGVPADASTFRLKCGTSPGIYTIAKDTGNDTVFTYPLSYVISTTGTYYCTITAYQASSGQESGPSNEVAFTAQVCKKVRGHLQCK